MCLVTLVHHLHASLKLEPGGVGMHVVVIEVVMIPATIISMLVFLRTASKVAFYIYIAISILGFFFLGLFEGGWNHTAKLIAYLRIDSPATRINEILPANDLNLWFYEGTGVATFIVTMIASWYSLRFFLVVFRSSKT